MKKIKEYFNTPKKALRSVGCITAVLVVLSAVILIAANIIAHKMLIGKAEAKDIALADAGLSASDISNSKIELDYENGSFEYEVEFYDHKNGKEYDYHIQGNDGAIISKEVESDERKQETQPQKPDAQETSSQEQTSQEPSSQEQTSQSQQPQEQVTEEYTSAAQQKDDISLQAAKAIALADAGLTEKEVTFTKAKLDSDDAISVYEIEFYSTDAEYDYEIKASNGAILDREIERKRQQSETQKVNTATSDKYIGVDKAKSIAVDHAKVSGQEVVFSKAKLENDHGEVAYEIEFYLGQMEYEYKIDAVSGKILEYDQEWDDDNHHDSHHDNHH